MLSINKVTVTGRLTRDPETKYLPSGTAVTTLGVAVNRVVAFVRFFDEGELHLFLAVVFLIVGHLILLKVPGHFSIPGIGPIRVPKRVDRYRVAYRSSNRDRS